MFMRKIKSTFLLLLAFCFAAFSQNEVSLISSKSNQTTVKFELNDFKLNKVRTENGIAYTISSENTVSSLEMGNPDLPKMTTSIIISDKDEMQINIVSSKFYELDDELLILPSKGNLTRDIDPSTVEYAFGEVYNNNAFFPAQIAGLEKPFILRDYRAQTISVTPFQYNPVTKKLRVYTEITVEITSTGQIGENVFNRNNTPEKVQVEFNNIYKNLFINYQDSKYTPVEEEGNMLIVCYDDFTSALSDFVLWKNQRGLATEIIPVSEIGTTAAAIKTYVQDYYNENGLTYLLLIGDAAQIPTNSGYDLGGDSDNAYAYVTGNDHYQEFFVGRFSAESIADVETQVERTIEYEKGNTLEDGWLNRTMGIASSQGPGDDGEYDYTHQQNIQIDLLGFTYVAPTIELFEGSQGGNDASGDPYASDVSDELNGDGAGIITYTGHGSDNSFVTTGFSNSDVNNLTNANRLPFIWSVACVNGNFVGQTCFAEAWLRATNNGEPTGAIATMMSTINQSWDPPMDGQDEMVDILVESYENNIKRTFGGISINGCLKMNETYGSEGDEMTDTWTLFGDPSLLVRTDNPAEMTISHMPTIIIGTNSFDVDCNIEDAVACLSKDGEIIGAAKVINGTASIEVSDITPGDFLDLVVTGFNAISYIEQVQVIAPEGAYVVSTDCTISDANGNNNSQADFGETFNLNISLKNVGVDPTSGNVTLNISSDNEYVESISTNNFDYQILAANQVATSSNSFEIVVSENTPDQTIINFILDITDGTDTWEGNLNITVNAPEFEIGEMEIDDENADGVFEPAETATATITVNNLGHADANEVLANLIGNSPYLTIIEESINFDIDAQGNTEISFQLEANESAAQGTIVELTNTVKLNDFIDEEIFNVVIGQLPIITIGDEETTQDYYPFYTYYENNKTQILYLGEEIGAGEKNIQEIAFDFVELGVEITSLTDLKISFQPTDITSLSSFETLNDATVVLNESSYQMPTEAGWYSFDIEDFIFNGEDNLLIEIVWGDNEAWESDHFTVNCSQTTENTVAYGYGDYENPPALSGTNNQRPNIQFICEAEPTGEEKEITFQVVANGKDILTDAIVRVGSLYQSVDASAETIFNIYEGTYTYTAMADGYENVSESFIADDNKTIIIEMGEFVSIYENQIDVKIYPNPTTGLVKIDSDITNAEIYIFDLTGKKVYQGIVNQSTTIDISALSKGAYIIKIIDNEQFVNEILIVE